MNELSNFDELSPAFDIPEELTKLKSKNNLYKNIIAGITLVAVVVLIFYIEKKINDE